MSICIDIDGTVTEPFYWLAKVNEYFKRTIKPNEVTVYEIHEVLGIEDKEYYQFYREHGEMLHRESKIRMGAAQVINRLYHNHLIHFVTARKARMYDVSVEWLEKFNIPMDTISLLGTHNKVSKAEELMCDIFIEDRYENAIQLSEAGFEVILIDCPYNQGSLHSNIQRVEKWYQIEQLIVDYVKVNKNKLASSL